jgi:hypothetical protein
MANIARALLRDWLELPTAEELVSRISTEVAAQRATRLQSSPLGPVDDNPENRPIG